MHRGFKRLTLERDIQLFGVYIIDHISTGRFYVGSTSSLYKRYTEHMRDLKLNRHINVFLQQCYNKDQELEWTFAVTENREDAFALEQEFLDRYFKTGKMLNIAPNAKGWVRKSRSMRVKIRYAMKALKETSGYRRAKKRRKKKKSSGIGSNGRRITVSAKSLATTLKPRKRPRRKRRSVHTSGK